MIAFWNRAEVYVGPSLEEFIRLRDRLDDAGIRHTYRIVSSNAAPGNPAARQSVMYYIYVHRKDAETVAPRVR